MNKTPDKKKHSSLFPGIFKTIGIGGPNKTDLTYIPHAIAIGLLCGLAMALFQWGVNGISYVIFGSSDISDNVPWFKALLAPFVGALLGGILLKFVNAKELMGSGIPQLKIAYHLKDGSIPVSIPPLKLVLGSLFLGTGSSLGMQGPVVQIGCSLGCLISKIFRVDKTQRREFVPVGVAGGIAAAFNTPIAAVVFTLEEMVGALNGRILGSTIIAAVSAAYISRTLLGDAPFLGHMEYGINHPSELIFYMVLGIVCGLVSFGIIIGILRLRSVVKRIPERFNFLKPAIGGLLVGAIAIFFPQVMGLGLDTIKQSLDGNFAGTVAASIQVILIIAGFKIIATLLSYSTGAVGGLLAPSLFIGAMIGSAMGIFTQWFYQDILFIPGETEGSFLQIHVGAFALVGMGAVFAGVTRVPFTSILIIFEMTMDYSLILPLMIANIISYSLSHALYPRRLYESFALQDGVHLPDHDGKDKASEKKVRDFMFTKYVSLDDDITVKKALEETVDLDYSHFPVMDELHRIVGLVHRSELIDWMSHGDSQTPLYELIKDRRMPFTYADLPIHVVLQRMGFHKFKVMPVLNRMNPRQIEGMIALKDVLKSYGIEES